MRCIGLTGGIATGKSTVGRLLVERGATLIDADVLAREVVEPGSHALAEIAARFGGGVLQPDGSLDRAALGSIVFDDAAGRRDLELITHPRITALLANRVAIARKRAAPLIVLDIPLLFESGAGAGTDGVMVVVAPPAAQLARLMARDGLTEDMARRRIAAQLPLEEKRAQATWVIDNGDGRDATASQVDRWWAAVVAQGAA